MRMGSGVKLRTKLDRARAGQGSSAVGARQGRWRRLCCTLSGSAADRWLEVPALRCLDPSRLTASPFVEIS